MSVENEKELVFGGKEEEREPVPEGEYEYSIFDSNNDVVGTGLIRLNELEQTNTVYNNNRTYIAYDKQ